MSEIYQVVKGDNAPAAYNHFDRIEFTRLDTGVERLYGIEVSDSKENKRQIKIGEFVISYGFDPNPQKPKKAVWKTEEQDIPVTIDGFIGRLDEEDYLRAQESKAGIPRSQLDWLPSDEETDQDPEKQQLKDQIEELRGMVNGFQERLEAQHRVHQESIQNLQNDHAEEIRKLREDYDGQIEDLRAQLDEAEKDPAPTDFKGGDGVKVAVDGRIVEGYIASDEPEWNPDKKAWTYEVAVDGNIISATVHELRAWQTLDITPPPGDPEVVDVSGDNWKSRWARIRGRTGNWATLRHPSQRALAAIQARGATRAVRVTDEEYYSQEDIDRGNRRLGGAALFGAGMLAWWLIDQLEDHGERKYGMPKANISKTISEGITVPVPSGNTQSNASSVLGISGSNNAGRGALDTGYISPGTHREYLHGGNNGFAVDLPRGAHLKQYHDGSVSIKGPDGSTWVDKIKGDEQGNLKKTIRQALLKKFKLHQDNLTYLDLTGPGKHGMVKHFVTAILAGK